MPAESVLPEEKVPLVFGNVLMVGRPKISTRLSSKFIMFSLSEITGHTMLFVRVAAAPGVLAYSDTLKIRVVKRP